MDKKECYVIYQIQIGKNKYLSWLSRDCFEWSTGRRQVHKGFQFPIDVVPTEGSHLHILHTLPTFLFAHAGQVTLVLLVLYSVARYTIESFRGDKIRGLWFDDTLSTSQLVSIVLGTLSLALLVAWRKRSEENRGFDAGLTP